MQVPARESTQWSDSSWRSWRGITHFLVSTISFHLICHIHLNPPSSYAHLNWLNGALGDIAQVPSIKEMFALRKIVSLPRPPLTLHFHQQCTCRKQYFGNLADIGWRAKFSHAVEFSPVNTMLQSYFFLYSILFPLSHSDASNNTLSGDIPPIESFNVQFLWLRNNRFTSMSSLLKMPLILELFSRLFSRRPSCCRKKYSNVWYTLGTCATTLSIRFSALKVL